MQIKLRVTIYSIKPIVVFNNSILKIKTKLFTVQKIDIYNTFLSQTKFDYSFFNRYLLKLD